MVGPQYVYVDVSSDDSAHWMTYHTHKKYMAAPHYARFDVSLDYPLDWMTY
jgi:hypothetical protein